MGLLGLGRNGSHRAITTKKYTVKALLNHPVGLFSFGESREERVGALKRGRFNRANDLFTKSSGKRYI